MQIAMTWKNTNLNGWEYLIVWKDLGSSPMYINCMIFIMCIILMLCLDVSSDNVIIKLYEFSQNMYWLNWLYTWLGNWLVVGSNLDENKTKLSFCPILILTWIWKGRDKT